MKRVYGHWQKYASEKFRIFVTKKIPKLLLTITKITKVFLVVSISSAEKKRKETVLNQTESDQNIHKMILIKQRD